jgi:hypothetical protein
MFALLLLGASLGATSPTFFEDFEKTPVGKVPDSINVLDGDFSIRDVDGNHCLELAGDPIGGFGALIGPGGLTSCDISARIWAAPSGKRFPEFGIGANDAGGPKLFVTPGTDAIELRWGESTIATSSFSWKPSTWTFVRLQLESRDGKWTVHGKAWNAGESEPAKWMVEAPLPKAPNPGRASVWGSDYSEKPIRFDDIRVNSVE